MARAPVGLGASNSRGDYLERGARFAVSESSNQQSRVSATRRKIGQSPGSSSVSVFGPIIDAGNVVELWAKVGPVPQLVASVAGPLAEGLWFRRTGEPVELWEVWMRNPGVATEGPQIFYGEAIYFAKAD